MRKFKIENRDTYDQCKMPKPKSPTYGFGFQIESTPYGLVVGHGGGFTGLNSKLDIFVDADMTSAVMSNIDRGAGPVADKIRELVGRKNSKQLYLCDYFFCTVNPGTPRCAWLEIHFRCSSQPGASRAK